MSGSGSCELKSCDVIKHPVGESVAAGDVLVSVLRFADDSNKEETESCSRLTRVVVLVIVFSLCAEF